MNDDMSQKDKVLTGTAVASLFHGVDLCGVGVYEVAGSGHEDSINTLLSDALFAQSQVTLSYQCPNTAVCKFYV
jgi:hypothetical protein